MTDTRPVRRRSMVGWYDPRVLMQSAYQIAIANIFGRHSDPRLIEALASQPQTEFDYAGHPGDFWLDYVSDVGDGWNPTYAVADAIARPDLEVEHDRIRETTRSGHVLVFGGDEVYPYPSRNEYEVRTESPYAHAFAGRPRPEVFAIPGNHDWYDSLVAFSRTFCRPERGFANCKTRQTRSYFALRLPANWWLIAIDLQLGADLDEPQVKYFQNVAANMDEAARLIFCVPEPRWILEDAYPRHTNYEELSGTRFLEEKVFRREARVFLTGDLHFYKRHENDAGVQKITSGGGGAFLHATHAPNTRSLRNGFDATRRVSRRENLAAPGVAQFSVSTAESEGGLVVRLSLHDVRVAGFREPRGVGRNRHRHGARCRGQRGDPRSAERHVAHHHHCGLYLLHGHTRAVMACIGRRVACRVASGGRLSRGLAGAAAHAACVRSLVWQQRATAGLGPDHRGAGSRWWARSCSASIYSCRSALSGGIRTRRFLRCASRISNSGCACASTHRERSRFLPLPSTGCHGAGARRSATARLHSWQTTHARRSRDSSTGLLCAPDGPGQ